ncbi:MAG: alcohol dehydrogenase catalytic domain-containing protein [Lachnospiraceae bacterium]|nr:alcohol dehydrogenase catalytic domain-containing protein [Lachnospiraceae bacterium]
MLSLLMPEYEKLELVEREIPECGPEEAVVRIKYAGICGSDMHIIAGENPRAKTPLIMGHESCGTVYAINSDRRSDIKVGDKVTMHAVYSCGVCDNCRNGHENLCQNVRIMGTNMDGFFQEYVKIRADRLLKFNDDVDMKAAALVEPLTIAVHDVRRSGLQLGQEVFVCGGGTIGTLIAKVAELQGGHVLVSEADDARIALCRKNGLNVVDAKAPDFMEQCLAFSGGQLFDKVFEVTGVEPGFNACLSVLKPGATFVQVGMPAGTFKNFDINKIIFNEIDFLGVRNSRSLSMSGAVKLVNMGIMNDFLRNMVSEIYPKEQAIEAFRRARTDKTALKVLINFGE